MKNIEKQTLEIKAYILLEKVSKKEITYKQAKEKMSKNNSIILI